MGKHYLIQTIGQENPLTRLCTLLLLFACISASAQTDSDQLLQDRLKAHIEFLASDELRGREPGTEGYDIAANYVASQFRQMGLVPARQHIWAPGRIWSCGAMFALSTAFTSGCTTTVRRPG